MLYLKRWAAAFAATFMCAVPAVAQNPTQWAIDLGQRGFVPGAPFDLSSLDSVDTVNGNVVVSVPLAALPAGHGGSGLDLTLTYNSGMYDTVTKYVIDSSSPPAFHADTRLIPPLTSQYWLYGYQYALWQQTRDPEPVIVQGTLSQYGCVTEPGGGVDLADSSQSALYPTRSWVGFPDGSSHVLVLTNLTAYAQTDGWSAVGPNGVVGGCFVGAAPLSYPLNYVTQDGTFVRFTITGQDSTDVPAWTMVFPDGRKVIGAGTTTRQIIDRNGNVINIANTSATDPPCYSLQGDSSDAVTTIRDTFGRCIQIERGQTSSGTIDWITQAAAASSNGPSTLVTSVNWTAAPIDFVYTYGSGGCQYGFETWCDPGSGSPPQTCTSYAPATQGTQVLVTLGSCMPVTVPMVGSIDLSQAGFSPAGTPLSYSFGYSEAMNSLGIETCVYCQLTDITLPRGVNTTWAAPTIHYTFNEPSGVPAYLPDMPIATKTLTHTDPYTGAAYTDNWSYSIAVPLGVSSSIPSNTVTNPDKSTTNYYVYPPNSSLLAGHAFKIDKFDPSGNLLSRLEQMWTANTGFESIVGPNVYLNADFRSVAQQGSATPVESAIRVYSVDVNGNIGSMAESDWVGYSTVSSLTHDSLGGISQLPSISAVRSTVNSYYVSASSSPYWGLGTSCTSSANPCILNSKSSTEISTGGTAAAYSEFVYDDATGIGADPGSGAGNVMQEWRWDSYKAPFPGAMTTGSTQTKLSGSNAIVTTKTYTLGDVLTETDANGNQSTFSYSSSSPYPSSLAEPLGLTWGFGWDLNSGLRTSETDPNGVPTNAGYDARGREQLRTLPGFWQTATTYDDSRQNAIASQDLGQTNDGIVKTTKLTDDLGRVYNTQTTDGSCTTNIQTVSLQQTPPGTGYSYQLTSNPFCSTTNDATMGWTLTQMDPLGRVVSVQHFSGGTPPSPWGSNPTTTGTATTVYNANQYTVTDEAGATRVMALDGLNRLTSVIEAGTYTTAYTYDGLDDLVRVNQNGGSQIRTFTYTSLGRLLSATNPESGTINYTYDNNGNLATRTDARQIQTIMTYDALNRMTLKSYTDGTPTVSYAYGMIGTPCAAYSIGRLCSVANSVSTTNYTQYDEAGHVLASSQSTQGTTYTFNSYTYNMLSELTSEMYPSRRTVSYTYDAGGRVNNVTGQAPQNGPTTHYASNIAYAPQHALSSLSLANGIAESWTYNGRLQPTQIQAGNLLTLGYVYGNSPTQNNGNLASATIGFGTTTINQAFSYDGVNRLYTAAENSSPCSASFTDWCQQFSYDPYGNRTVQSSYGQGISSLTPTGFSSSNQNSGTGWAYDLAGNITADPGPSAYVYDAENRQTAYCMNASTCTVSGATMAYSYDGNGKRVQTVGAGVTTTFVYDAKEELIAEYGSTPPPCTHTCYVTVDSLGSTRIVTDQNGICVSREDYLPFGQAILATSGNPRGSCYGEPPIRQQFSGKERDSETGFDFFEARYMSSAEGRFTSPDPLGGHLYDPQTLNKYAYVRNNPLSLTDPSGLDFYLTCAHSDQNAETCQQVDNGGQKSWVQGTTTNGQFGATVISNGANGTLVDQNGNQYTGSFNQNGASFTSDNGNGVTSSGVFQNGSSATTLSGSGLFQGLTGVFNDNCGGTCVASGSIFGTKDQFATLKEQMLHNPGIDAVDFFHLTFLGFGPQNYRNGNPTGPDPHLVSSSRTENAGYDQLHYDSSYPYATVPGFFDHSGSALRSIGHIFTGPQALPPPTTIP